MLIKLPLAVSLIVLEPKIEWAKQQDEYVNNKTQVPEPEPEAEQIVYITKTGKQKKEIIYKEVEKEEEKRK